MYGNIRQSHPTPWMPMGIIFHQPYTGSDSTLAIWSGHSAGRLSEREKTVGKTPEKNKHVLLIWALRNEGLHSSPSYLCIPLIEPRSHAKTESKTTTWNLKQSKNVTDELGGGFKMLQIWFIFTFAHMFFDVFLVKNILDDIFCLLY